MSTPRIALETPRRKIITLTRVPKTDENKSGIAIDPYTFKVGKEKNEEVTWVCEPPVPFSVDFEFPEGSPFYEKQFGDEAPISGLVRRDVLCGPQRFRYTVTIGNDKHNSPDGQVDP